MDFKYQLPYNCPNCLNDSYNKLEEKNVYRLSKSRECISTEHKPSAFDKNHFCVKKNISLIENCQCHGLSVELEKEDIIKKSKRYKKLGNYIFYAKITIEDGVLYLTGNRQSPKHCTLFIFNNKEECDIFEFYEEID